MRLKTIGLLLGIMSICALYGCKKEESGAGLEKAAADYDAEPILSEEELEKVVWDETILPYMEYDWLADTNIERYLDTSWLMQLADLNLDGQKEMLVTLPIYNRDDMTFVYTVENGTVVYCGRIVAGPAFDDNASFMEPENYLPSNYIDVYQNQSGELRYLSSDAVLMDSWGYYQIYENTFDGTHISGEPFYAIHFFQDTDGTENYQYAAGDWLEREGEETDDQNYTAFTKVMEAYMKGWEKTDISFIESEFRVPGIVDELSEEKKEIVRNNIVAGFAKALENVEEEEEVYEDVADFFDAITGDMLDACKNPPASDESFDNDPMILLNWYSDDIRLYGINVGKEEAMLLYAQGEKMLISHPYRNIYRLSPMMKVYDRDLDDVEEVIIGSIIGSDTSGDRFALTVCDYEDGWKVYDYDDWQQDVEELVHYQYDEAKNSVIFLDKKDTTLSEVVLPREWAGEFADKGVISFEDDNFFNIEALYLEVRPHIGLKNMREDPYIPIVMIFDINYTDGEFEMELNSVHELK